MKLMVVVHLFMINGLQSPAKNLLELNLTLKDTAQIFLESPRVNEIVQVRPIIPLTQ